MNLSNLSEGNARFKKAEQYNNDDRLDFNSLDYHYGWEKGMQNEYLSCDCADWVQIGFADAIRYKNGNLY